eukprot:TRINITY_DN40233_c0_g1_i1.p2 TRINITY_DN40233_c0_g1~~TRINITY_DN40233_c0_g1_i1.p2  ORF type:complete len:517 (+),score=83.42 TRINITY_DN40233_c0_g1_i1:86-1636(+)
MRARVLLCVLMSFEVSHAELQCRSGGEAVTCQKINVLTNLPITGKWKGGPSLNISGHQMAALINSEQLLLPGYELVLHVNNDDCRHDESSKMLLQAITDEPSKFVALVGTGCSSTSKATASLAPIIRMPHISWASVAADLSNRALYPTFFRTRVPDSSANTVWLRLASLFNWRKLVVAKGGDDRFGYQTTSFIEAASDNGIQIVLSSSVLVQADAQRVLANVLEVHARIIVMITYEYSISYLLCEAAKENAHGLIILTKTHADAFWREPFEGKDSRCSDSAMDRMAEHLILVGGGDFRGDESNLTCVNGMTSSMYKKWWDDFSEAHANTPLLPTKHNAAANAADGVCMLALALKTLFSKNITIENMTARSGEVFAQFNEAFAATRFEGVSGTVSFHRDGGDGAGDPLGPAYISQIQNASLLQVGLYEGSNITFKHQLTWPYRAGSGNMSYPADTFDPCPPGYRATGMSCTPCDPGSFAVTSGSASCSLCQPGLVARQAGSSACEDARMAFTQASVG